jgi:predicted esterase
VELARQTRDILEHAGATVLYRETSAGHEIDGDIVGDLRAFLATLP